MGRLSPREVMSPRMLLVVSRADAWVAAFITQLYTTPPLVPALSVRVPPATLQRHSGSLSVSPLCIVVWDLELCCQWELLEEKLGEEQAEDLVSH